MPILTHGDLFDADADILVNCVNCDGIMGAGIALAFKTRYPEMFQDYREACKQGRVAVGKLHVWKSPSGQLIINFPTKNHWRDLSRYEDIEAGLRALSNYLELYRTYKLEQDVRVAVPALGCGLGGLNWERVERMIYRQLSGLKATILVFRPNN